MVDGTLIIWVDCSNQGDLSFVCCARIQWIDINKVLEGCQFGLRRWVPDLVVSVDSIIPSKCRATVCPFLLAEDGSKDHLVNFIAWHYFNVPLFGEKVASWYQHQRQRQS